ncbi:MAG: SEC-C domain-containing protein [Actinobacteria bacterium]|nr:SEC-C domain-containing protein [Actinomycetota bacterium]
MTTGDPEESSSRANYAAEVVLTGMARVWPPGRNDPCWCGSMAKYKRCCAALRSVS